MSAKPPVPHRKLQVAPTFTGAAFSAGDAVGVKFTIPDAGGGGNTGGVIRDAVLASKIAFAAADLFLFDADFTGVADNAAFAITVADLPKLVGVISFAAGVAGGTPSVSTVQNTNLAFAGKTLYGQLVTRGTPTYTAGDLTVILVVQPDLG